MYWFFLLAWMPRLLIFPCHYIWTADNQLTGSIPSELGELTLLAKMALGTWIGFSCWQECHACSHFLAITSEQLIINSRVPFRANSVNLLCWLYWSSVRGLVFTFFIRMSRLLTFPCHSVVRSDFNELTSSIPSELGRLTSLTGLWLCTWIGGSCSYECHPCSHFLAILFD
jgi:hypothetical protein